MISRLNDLELNVVAAIAEEAIIRGSRRWCSSADVFRLSDAHHARFVQPGNYKAKFYYSSDAPDCMQWEGPMSDWPMRAEVIHGLESVPRLVLEDSISVTVVE